MTNNLTTLCLAYAGFAALSLAMERHWSDRFGREARPGRWRAPLQVSGAALLIASLALCLASDGFGIGLIAWVGCLTAAGGALVLALTYWPKAVTISGPALLGLGVLMATAGRL